MKSSHGRITHVLEICSVKDHFYRMTYENSDKANTAALGFLNAMRNAAPEAVAAMWENGTMCTFEGVASIKIPVFAIRAGEIGSVCLRPVSEYKRPDREGDEWKGSN